MRPVNFPVVVAWATRRSLAMLALALAMLAPGRIALAQASVGEIEFSRGVGSVQSPGQPARSLGKGVTVKPGDRVSTSAGTSAILKLDDGSKLTLRPNTELVLKEYRFKADAPSQNAMVLTLERGGIRAATGSITRGADNAARLNTATASVAIRGTNFDARICGAECKTESSRVQQQARPGQVQASAKLVSSQGRVDVLDNAGQRRQLVVGGSVYPGETIETQANTKAVIAFRDESRMTVGAGTRFKVENFVFDEKAPGEGRFLASVEKGTARVLTGLIAKSNGANVQLKTPSAIIGVRGTGLDVSCASAEGCGFFAWLGSITVTPEGQTALQVLQAGQGLFVGPGGIRPLSETPVTQLERPDGVTVDTKQLFSSGPAGADQEGLYVYVRDGHIEVVAFGQTIQLGRGETSFAGGAGAVYRLPITPLFIDHDRVPLPESKNPGLVSLMNYLGRRGANQCQ